MSMSDIRTVWQPVKPWVAPVVEEICATRRIYFVWGKSSGTSGEHPLGRALDFSVLEWGNGVYDPGDARPYLGADIATYLWANRARLNVWYIIWNRRIISTSPNSYAFNRWVEYRGEKPHTDHVHVSFYDNRVYTPPDIIERLMKYAMALGPAILVKDKNNPEKGIFAVTFEGLAHIKNPTQRDYLEAQGWVTKTVKEIDTWTFNQLNEKEQ